jgi:hypothetical protein
MHKVNELPDYGQKIRSNKRKERNRRLTLQRKGVEPYLAK